MADNEEKIYTFQHEEETVKVFLPKFELDIETIKQIKSMMKNTVLTNIRIMPDCHRGVGCVVGLTAQIDDKIVPKYVGSDIGCGISLDPLDIRLKPKKLPKLERLIRMVVPMSENINDICQVRDNDWEWIFNKSNYELVALKIVYEEDGYIFPDEFNMEYMLDMIEKVRGNEKTDLRSLGSLGGGNHYVEVNEDDEGDAYLTVHSGSRNLGLKVCKYHQDKINDYCKFNWEIFNKRMKVAKRKSRVSKELYEMELKIKAEMESELHPKYLEGQEMIDYLIDMIICQNLASLNRVIMIRNILENLGIELNMELMVETKHNYIDFNRFILRKGSISAEEGEKCIISLNMRDGILLCEGKGNPDWNYSSAHGCGRIMSRQQASRLNMKEFTKEMEDVYTTCVRKETLDESPMAYRDVNLVKECLEGSVIILKQLKPVINCKGW